MKQVRAIQITCALVKHTICSLVVVSHPNLHHHLHSVPKP